MEKVCTQAVDGVRLRTTDLHPGAIDIFIEPILNAPDLLISEELLLLKSLW
jgi:hypothetical protein